MVKLFPLVNQVNYVLEVIQQCLGTGKILPKQLKLSRQTDGTTLGKNSYFLLVNIDRFIVAIYKLI